MKTKYPIPCRAWISVKDKLPNEFKEYFVITIYGDIKVDEWRELLGGSWLGVERKTHWLPIPKKPQKEVLNAMD